MTTDMVRLVCGILAVVLLAVLLMRRGKRNKSDS